MNDAKEPRFGRVTANVVANVIGRAPALLSFVFVPLFVRYLGPESYGLVGVYYTLVALVSLLDLGLSTATVREVARLQEADPARVGSFARAVETVYVVTAVVIGIATVGASRWIAERWLNTIALPRATVAHSIVLIGLAIAAQWPSAAYRSVFQGLQRQTFPNVVLAVSATLRPFLLIAALRWVSNTITVFFSVQLLLSGLTTIAMAVATWRALRRIPAPRERRSFAPLRSIARFAGHLSLNAVLALCLGNVDKVTISKLAPLDALGFYTIAAGAASLIVIASEPFFAAAFPRFVELAGRGDEVRLCGQYRLLSQAVSAVVLPAAIVGAVFSETVMLSYLRDPRIAAQTQLAFRLLLLANLFSALITVPYALQLAFEKTSIVLSQNAISLLFALPASIWAVARYGIAGAAAVLCIVNAACLAVTLPLTHRALLRGESARWLIDALAKPAAAAGGVALLARIAISRLPPGDARTLAAIVAGGAALAAAALAAPEVRLWMNSRIFSAFPEMLRRFRRPNLPIV